MIWVWTIICTAAVVGSCVLLGLVERGARKWRLLAAPGGIGCDAPEEFGISVLCCGTCDAEQIAALMSEECARYEVVVAIDALRRPAEFEALAARYCMTRVEWRGSDELPVSGIRAVGRSRKRRYRRLVLVDRAQGTPEGDLNAAAVVATYDYLLPLDCGRLDIIFRMPYIGTDIKQFAHLQADIHVEIVQIRPTALEERPYVVGIILEER